MQYKQCGRQIYEKRFELETFRNNMRNTITQHKTSRNKTKTNKTTQKQKTIHTSRKRYMIEAIWDTIMDNSKENKNTIATTYLLRDTQ